MLSAASAGYNAALCSSEELSTYESKRDKTAHFWFKIEKSGNHGPNNGADYGTALKLAGTNSEPVSAICTKPLSHHGAPARNGM
jgi:hypothetical protein